MGEGTHKGIFNSFKGIFNSISFTENTVKDEAHRINKAIGAWRACGLLSQSEEKREALREAQRGLNLPEHAMVTDCQTWLIHKKRWREFWSNGKLWPCFCVDNGERSNVCWAQHLHALCSPWTRSTEMVEEMQNTFSVAVQSRTEISVHTSNKLCVRESF